MGIEIPIAADSRQFIGATKDMARGLDAVADALDDIARDSQRSSDRMDDGIRDTGKETERLERTFRDMSRTVERESKDAGRKIDDGIGGGLKKAEAGMEDFKGEAASTAREGAASFTGEWDDVGDIVQETLANALGGFGPIGAAAGVAMAVGFGALYAKIQADTEASEQRVEDMYQGMLDSQSRYLNEESIMSGVDTLIQDAGKLAEAQEIASASGVDLGLALRAMAGDAEAAATVNAGLDATYQDVIDSANQAAKEQRDLTAEELEQAQAVGKAADAMSGYSDEVTRASEKYDAYTSAQRAANKATNDAAVAAARAAGIIRDMPNGKVIKVTADTSTLVSDVRYAMDRMGQVAKGGVNVPIRATNTTGRVVY